MVGATREFGMMGIELAEHYSLRPQLHSSKYCWSVGFGGAARLSQRVVQRGGG